MSETPRDSRIEHRIVKWIKGGYLERLDCGLSPENCGFAEQAFNNLDVDTGLIYCKVGKKKGVWCGVGRIRQETSIRGIENTKD